ncbi:hypothetical protein DDY07_08355 [Methylomonas sp. ZR1]|nr:hypothetical protein [Methylomonas sp. ZR1]
MRSFIPIVGLALCTACASPSAVDEHIHEIVIGSMMLDSKKPWHLDSAWQAGGIGGSALRTASIEHVVRQVDQPWRAVNDTVAKPKHPDNRPADSIEFTQINDPSQLERAWRKYCHHQLDLSLEERALIDSTAMPIALQHACNPSSLLK